MSRLLYELDVILQHIIKMFCLIVDHDKDSQTVVNLYCQFVMKELALMITKTLFILCYFIKCGLSCDTLQHNIMHYIIDLTIN